MIELSEHAKDGRSELARNSPAVWQKIIGVVLLNTLYGITCWTLFISFLGGGLSLNGVDTDGAGGKVVDFEVYHHDTILDDNEIFARLIAF